ncbi:hypothetical protein TNCT_84571 [Trichonephila clavata]|uniref:Transposase n=1 Tax=Trichonephila clavata TaxID=2740835 RepID=A0A8X6GR23_TRICU|nr:hypothetical protein TNCT_84571 [Trichonephila clavata]
MSYCSAARGLSVSCVVDTARAGYASLSSAKRQFLQPNDYWKRMEFALWFTQKGIDDPSFPALSFFADEASFSCKGVFNAHNSHLRAYDNPHVTRSHAAQHCFAVNMWASRCATLFCCKYVGWNHWCSLVLILIY